MADTFTDAVVNDAWGADPSTSDGFAKIHLARVVSVDMEAYTVDVATVFTHVNYGEVPFSSPYTHGDHPGGVYVMPEVGAYCYLCQTGDDTAFVFAWITNPVNVKKDLVNEDGVIEQEVLNLGPSFAGHRDPLEPGDIFLGTVDENRIMLRRGGIIQIAATSLAQRLYIPVENVVRDYFQRYQAYSPVGEIEWGHATLVAGESPTIGPGELPTSEYLNEADDHELLDTIENTPVLIKYNIKDTCQEDVYGETDETIQSGTKIIKQYTVELRVGRLTDDTLDPEEDPFHKFANPYLSNTYLENKKKEEAVSGTAGDGITPEKRGAISLTVYSHDEGANQHKVTYAFQLNRDGDNFIFSRGSIHTEVKKSVYANVEKSIRIEAGGKNTNSPNKQALIDLLEDGEVKQYFKAMLFDVVADVVRNIGGDVTDTIKGSVDWAVDKHAHFDVKETIHLGKENLQEVVIQENLENWRSACVVTTPAGPGTLTTPCAAGVVSSTTVKAKP
jgi:hypothetical protein